MGICPEEEDGYEMNEVGNYMVQASQYLFMALYEHQKLQLRMDTPLTVNIVTKEPELKFSSKEYMQVQYKDLLDDPINLMKDIYANFDFHLDEKTLTEMTGYIEKGSLEDKAKHKYSLEDYGLDEAEVHNKLNYS